MQVGPVRLVHSARVSAAAPINEESTRPRKELTEPDTAAVSGSEPSVGSWENSEGAGPSENAVTQRYAQSAPIGLLMRGMRCGCWVCCIPVVIRDISEEICAVVEVAGHLTFLNAVDEQFSIAEIIFELVHQGHPSVRL